MRYTITARCSNNHVQSVTTDQFSDHDAYALARVIDLTSDMFTHTTYVVPGPVLGRCGACGSPFTCTVRPG